MHLTEVRVGVLGCFAVVGAGLPVAAGAAWAAQTQGTQQVALTYFGDGSTNIGAFHETLNISAVWSLPIVLICENNLYGEYSPISSTTPPGDLARRAHAYGIPGHVVDGNDVAAVYRSTHVAIEKARRGDGPTFLEMKTYRHKGHSRSDPAKYRPPGELERWIDCDPIERWRQALLAADRLSVEKDEEIRRRSMDTIDKVVREALDAPYPDREEVTSDVFSG